MTRLRVLLLALALFGALAALIWTLSVRYKVTPVTPVAPRAGEPEKIEPPTATPSASATPVASPGAPPVVHRAPSGLIIPVAGIRPDQLSDTFTQSRSEGRTHNALDIMASRGTPVLAAADGTIMRLFNSERGGLTIYQIGTDQKTVYYYAHLERYADGLTEQRPTRQGETIGYVGDTGNAGSGNYHLHFAIWAVSDPKHFWEGDNINPYPLLVQK